MNWYTSAQTPLIVYIQMNWVSTILDNPFYEVAIILTLAAFFGILGQIMKTTS